MGMTDEEVGWAVTTGEGKSFLERFNGKTIRNFEISEINDDEQLQINFDDGTNLTLRSRDYDRYQSWLTVMIDLSKN